jgi:hypothetical protein
MLTSTSPTVWNLPDVGGFTGTIQIPAANTSANMTLNVSTQPPTWVPILSARRRSTAIPETPYLYFQLVSGAPVTLNGTFAFNITPPPSVSLNQQFFLDGYLIDGTWGSVAGPATLSNGALSLSVQGDIYFDASAEEVFLAFYAGTVMLPGPEIVASPSSISIMGAGNVQTTTLTDKNPTTTLSIDASACAGVAGVQKLSASTFQFTSLGAGTCNATATDDFGHSATIPVAVQTASVIVN